MATSTLLELTRRLYYGRNCQMTALQVIADSECRAAGN